MCQLFESYKYISPLLSEGITGRHLVVVGSNPTSHQCLTIVQW